MFEQFEINLQKALEHLNQDLEKLPDRLQAILREADKITIDKPTEKILDSLHGTVDPDTILKLKMQAVAEQKSERLNVFMKELHHIFRTHLSLAESCRGNAIGQCNAVTTLSETGGEALERMSNESKRREARDILRGKKTDAKHGTKTINERLEFLKSVMDTPDALLYLYCLQEHTSEALVSPETLAELREQYTRKHKPELLMNRDSAIFGYKSVRKQCAEFNSTVMEVLMENGIESPISLEEHFVTFVPQSARDHEMMNERLLAEQRKRNAEAQTLESGVNFQASGLTLKQVRAAQQ